jgi:hypothetical protein
MVKLNKTVLQVLTLSKSFRFGMEEKVLVSVTDRTFLITTTSKHALRLSHPLIQRLRGVVSLWLKRSKREAEHKPPFNATGIASSPCCVYIHVAFFLGTVAALTLHYLCKFVINTRHNFLLSQNFMTDFYVSLILSS